MIARSLCAMALCLFASTATAGDPIISFPKGHTPEMEKAIVSAHRSLDTVLRHLTAENGQISPALNLKVAVPVEGGTEHIWVQEVSHAFGRHQFSASLANAPNDLDGLTLGDRIKFGRDQISDWGLMGPNGQLWGHFTTRLLLDDMDVNTRSYLISVLSADPVPPPWQ